MKHAFPHSTHDVNDQGMTLRDYFAAKAMVAYIQENYAHKPEDGCKWSTGDVAAFSYMTADDMLKAREEE